MNLDKEKRIEQILLSLKKLDYLTRSQIQRIHNLGGKRNANKILQNMGEYLSSWRERETIYYLSREGREYTGATKVRKKSPQAEHFLMRNDTYIFFGMPTTWRTELKVKKNDVSIVPDALFQHRNTLHLLEVDRTQYVANNKKKIDRYRKLAQYGPFKLVWITTSPHRKNRLKSLSEGLDYIVYTIDEIRS